MRPTMSMPAIRRKKVVQDSHQLRQASAIGDLRGIEAALKAGQDVDERDADGWFALALAACSGKGMGMPCEALIKHGCDIDQRLPNGATAVYLAAQNGHLGAVQKLVAAGVDLTLGCGGDTPAAIAQKRNYRKVAAVLAKETVKPNPVAERRMAIKEKEAGDKLAMQRAVLVVQGAWRSKLARREAERMRLLGNQAHVLPPDLDMEGFQFTWAAFKDLVTRSIPLFITAAVFCWDKFTDWVVFLQWLFDAELRDGPLWWAPLASFVVLALTGLMSVVVALEEPHNLGTVGFGDKDPRFITGRIRRYAVCALGGLGALPLTYAMGYARLGPATAMSNSDPMGVASVVTPEGEPRFFRNIQLVYVMFEVIPQAMLQMFVGVMDARLDPFGAADSGLAGVRDGTLDGGEALAVQAAGLPLREDGDYSDYDLKGVGGSSRFSFVLFVSLASSFGAAGVAFGTYDAPDGAVPFYRHKLYRVHRPLTALWRAGELMARCSLLVLFGCATGWAGIIGAWFFDAVLLSFAGIVVEHYKEFGDVRSMSERFGLALLSFMLYFGVMGGTEAGLSSLHSQGLVVSGSKFFVLRLIETAIIAALFYSATWGWVDPEYDANYYRKSRAVIHERTGPPPPSDDGPVLNLTQAVYSCSSVLGEGFESASCGGQTCGLQCSGSCVPVCPLGLFPPTVPTLDDVLTTAAPTDEIITVANVEVELRSTPRFECEAQQAALAFAALGTCALYGILPLAWLLDPARWRPSDRVLALEKGEDPNDGRTTAKDEEDEIQSVAGTNAFIIARLSSNFGTVFCFGAAVPVVTVLGLNQLSDFAIIFGSMTILRLWFWGKYGHRLRARCCSKVEMDPSVQSACTVLLKRMLAKVFCECCACWCCWPCGFRLRFGDRWTQRCCTGRGRRKRVAAYEASSAWAKEADKATTQPLFPAHMAVHCSNMMVSGGISFNSGCDALIEPPRACAIMKCYNCGNTIAAGRYPGLAELIRARDARKAEIVEIYEEHNPQKLYQVDALLEEWVGEEGVLLLKIRNKYLPPPMESSEDESPPTVRYKSLTTGIIREGADPGSAKAGKLEVGEVVVVLAEHELESGVLRVMCEKGWVSVTAKTGKAMMERLPEELTRKQQKYRERLEFERRLALGDDGGDGDGDGGDPTAAALVGGFDRDGGGAAGESGRRELMTMEQYEAEMAAEDEEATVEAEP
jgi:hypothetical protein